MNFNFILCLFLIPSLSSIPVSPDAVPENNGLVKGEWFDRILIINLENCDYRVAMDTPALAEFAKLGVALKNYYGVTHPSQPNYIAQIYGQTVVWTDLNSDIKGKSLVDLLETKGISWKSYQENYPGGCYVEAKSPDGLYRRKHNPFISMARVNQDTTYCAQHIVDEHQFDHDLKHDLLPQLCYYTPNMNNDGHDTSVAFAGEWFSEFSKKYFPQLSNSNTLILLTFDEQDSYFMDNKVYAVLYGAPVRPFYRKNVTTGFNHYSILRTIELNWDLGGLGRYDELVLPFFPITVQEPLGGQRE